jgi:Chemoreceptor zinc-binding domain
MNFDDAIAAHIKWKVRLTQFIDGTGTEKLDSNIVCKDNMCDLGKWIYGEGAKYKTVASHKTLQDRHAHFHKCAADVVKKVETGDPAGAKSMLAGVFATASKDTIGAIMQLKKEVGT